MGVESPWALNVIRASRADPPGLAASDRARRRTYGAALQQFDELLEAEVGAHGAEQLGVALALVAEVEVLPDDHHVHAFVALGSASLESGDVLDAGAAARLTEAGALTLTAGGDGAEILVWATA